MPIMGVSITKSTAFRQSTQRFSNVYHYFTIGIPDAATANAAIDEIITAERAMHATNVNFVEARAWSAGGTPQENETVVIRDLSGAGSLTPDLSVDPERAVLVVIPCERDDVRGRKVYLRKWYHSRGTSPGVGDWGPTIYNQSGKIPQTQKDHYRSRVENLFNLGPSENIGPLCAPSGRQAIFSQIQVYDWLEHHQFGDQWR